MFLLLRSSTRRMRSTSSGIRPHDGDPFYSSLPNFFMSEDNPMEDSFEAAVDAVNGAVETVREVKSYPMVPKGMHKAKCIEAKIEETEYEGKKRNVLTLVWELEATYGEGEEKRNHRMWDRLGLSYGGARARLPKVFRELTGQEITPLVRQEKFKKDGKEYIKEVFQFEAFVEMETEMLVKHEPGKTDPTKTYAKIAEYSCNPEQQKKNASLVFTE